MLSLNFGIAAITSITVIPKRTSPSEQAASKITSRGLCVHGRAGTVV